MAKILVEVYTIILHQKEVYFPCVIRHKYLKNLRNIKQFINKQNCTIFVAISKTNQIVGAIFYYSSLKDYGLEYASQTQRTSALRYLAVNTSHRGKNIAKELIRATVQQARKDKCNKMILHTMDSMKEATNIYTQFDFKRDIRTDFQLKTIKGKGYYKIL